jgi:hypothetical protein
MQVKAGEKQRKVLDWFDIYSDSSLSIACRGLNMKRIDIFSFYVLGTCVAPLKLLWDLDAETSKRLLSAAKAKLEELQKEQLEFLRILGPAIQKVIDQVNEAIKFLQGQDFTLRDETGHEVYYDLVRTVDDFQKVLKAASPSENTYLVDRIRGLSMRILIEAADENLSAATLGKIGNEARKYIVEAGRCLAFELPTAAGVHTMRAFEKVLRRYYSAVTKVEAGHTDIKRLLEILEKRPDADMNLLAVLDNIRNLHSNPLAHEVFLDTDEAVDLFYIANSAITAMARAL